MHIICEHLQDLYTLNFLSGWKGLKKFIPRDSLNSPLLYILFSMVETLKTNLVIIFCNVQGRTRLFVERGHILRVLARAKKVCAPLKKTFFWINIDNFFSGKLFNHIYTSIFKVLIKIFLVKHSLLILWCSSFNE